MANNKDRNIYEIAVSHYESGRAEQALNICLEAIQKGIQDSNLIFLSGIIYRDQGDLSKSLSMLNRAVSSSRDNPLYQVNLGISYHMGNMPEEAKKCYGAADRLNPGQPQACNNLGQIYLDSGKPDTALEWFNKCLKSTPDFYMAWFNMGIAYQRLGNYDKAEQSYQNCLKVNPDYGIALNNLAVVYKLNHRFEKSAETFRRLLKLEPEYLDAYNNLGAVYQEMGEVEKAVECYRKSISADTGNTVVLANYINQLMYLCEWEEANPLAEKLKQMSVKELKLGKKCGITPLDAIQFYDDPGFNLMVSRAYGLEELRSQEVHGQFYPSGRPVPSSSPVQKNTKIKIGYVSDDLRDHAIGHILSSLFTVHDRNAFEIVCYSHTKPSKIKNNPFTRTIRQNCDRFIDIAGLDTFDSARAIYQDGINILIDLKGYTHSGRMGIFALRPAPVQIAYLGFLSTTGTPFMDYIIADQMVLPDTFAKFYSEKIIYLPCYQVTDYSYLHTETEWNRKKCGLPEDGFVFCSFNQPYKFNADLFAVWMRLLKQKKKSVLWLRHTSEPVKKNLCQTAKSMGVAQDRLVFSESIGLADHLKRLELADLALDTWGYNGGATTNNALWAGVPVVTRQGKQFVARMSSSSLNAINMNELVTDSADGYEALCKKLISDHDYYQRIRDQLKKNKNTSILFDVKRFAGDLENAYQKAWESHLPTKGI